MMCHPFGGNTATCMHGQVHYVVFTLMNAQVSCLSHPKRLTQIHREYRSSKCDRRENQMRLIAIAHEAVCPIPVPQDVPGISRVTGLQLYSSTVLRFYSYDYPQNISSGEIKASVCSWAAEDFSGISSPSEHVLSYQPVARLGVCAAFNRSPQLEGKVVSGISGLDIGAPLPDGPTAPKLVRSHYSLEVV